jgi:hypothetical protein
VLHNSHCYMDLSKAFSFMCCCYQQHKKHVVMALGTGQFAVALCLCLYLHAVCCCMAYGTDGTWHIASLRKTQGAIFLCSVELHLPRQTPPSV